MVLNCHSKSALDVAQTPELRQKLASEHRGHQLLEACRQADPSKVKKCLSSSNNSSSSGAAAAAQQQQQPPPQNPSVIAENPLSFRHPYSGDTALHCACASPFPKRKGVADLLCRRGAGLNDKNKEMLTPLHVAADKSHYDVMDVLLNHGAKVRTSYKTCCSSPLKHSVDCR